MQHPCLSRHEGVVFPACWSDKIHKIRAFTDQMLPVVAGELKVAARRQSGRRCSSVTLERHCNLRSHTDKARRRDVCAVLMSFTCAKIGVGHRSMARLTSRQRGTIGIRSTNNAYPVLRRYCDTASFLRRMANVVVLVSTMVSWGDCFSTQSAIV